MSAKASPSCKFKSAHSCRCCGRWLEGEWSSADIEQHIELQRQMDAGHCDACHRLECMPGVLKRAKVGHHEQWWMHACGAAELHYERDGEPVGQPCRKCNEPGVWSEMFVWVTAEAGR